MSADQAVATASNFPAASHQYHLDRQAKAKALQARYPSLHLIPLNSYTLSLHTRLRNAKSDTAEFVQVGNLLNTQLIQQALATLPTKTVTVATPTAVDFVGCELTSELCGVSIVRAGESMESSLRCLVPSVKIGKVLIQRNEASPDKNAQFFYSKLPPHIERYEILLLDPMLASGGSAICAIQHLLSKGVSLSHITFVNLISSPEGLEALFAAYPTLRVVSGILDEKIDSRKFILPGVGDFGDRYFGTVPDAE